MACMANKLMSSKRPATKFAAASQRAAMSVDWNLTYIEGVPGPWGHIPYSCDIFHINF